MKTFKMTSVPFNSEIPTIYNVGQTFSSGCHYFLQRENDVLHVKENELINVLFVNHLTDRGDLTEITDKDFENTLRATIYHLEIDKYWNKN